MKVKHHPRFRLWPYSHMQHKFSPCKKDVSKTELQMVWIFLIILLLGRIGIIRANLVLMWKGTVWRGLLLGERLGDLERALILTVRFIVLHALLFTRFYMSSELVLSHLLLTTILLAGSILLFIRSNSLFSLFLGWDGLGISSFFLVIWYQSWNRLDRGMVTFLSNRLGDFFLIFSRIRYFSFGWVIRRARTALRFSFLLILACFTKRAQVPFTVWLPIAISAPTPISALVHSRTLVTAGLFMALKFSSFLISSLFWIAGRLTMFVAGLISFLELDLKKVVALSTLRQLGFMRTSVGAGGFRLTFLHIMSHALIKSALFILVGVLLHVNFSSQDKRLIQILRERESFCLSGLVLCAIALCGLAFTRGLISKEAILFLRGRNKIEILALFTFFLLVSLTFIYCGRLLRVGLQPRLLSEGRARRRTKAIARSGGLLCLSVRSAWRLRDSLSYCPPTNKRWEVLLPGLLFLLATCTWIRVSPFKLIFSTLGWALGLRQLNKSLLNPRKKDRETTDQANWITFKWLNYAWVPHKKEQKGAYLLFYLLLTGLLLF